MASVRASGQTRRQVSSKTLLSAFMTGRRVSETKRKCGWIRICKDLASVTHILRQLLCFSSRYMGHLALATLRFLADSCTSSHSPTELVGSAYHEIADEKYNRGRREYWLKTGCLMARDGPPGQRMGPLWPQARKMYTGQPGFELDGEDSDGSWSTSSGSSSSSSSSSAKPQPASSKAKAKPKAKTKGRTTQNFYQIYRQKGPTNTQYSISL